MKRFSAIVVTFSIVAACTTPALWTLERETVTTAPPAVIRGALSALQRDVAERAACYRFEVEKAERYYFVAFYSPIVAAQADPVTVSTGSGPCGESRIYALDERGRVLGSRFGR